MMENSENPPDVTITPAPGYVLVVQDKTTGGSIGGMEIAAKTQAMHEGTVVAIGYVPKRYDFGLVAGDKITFARFNAVSVPGVDYLAVSMTHIVCKKTPDAPKGWWGKLWRKVKGMLMGGRLAGAFAAGWFANDAMALLKKHLNRN